MSTWFGKKKKPTGRPDCVECNGTGIVIDSYWGDEVDCKCTFSNIYKKKEAKEAKKNKLAIVDYKGQAEYFDKTFVLDNSKEALEDKVKNKGVDLDILVAASNELQIDYDSDEIPEQFHKMLPILRQRFSKGVIFWKKQRSSSGKHWHVIITLPEDIDNKERILWQAVFGSDCMREGLSILRVAAGMDNPTLLFVPKNVEVAETGMLDQKPARKFKELV